MGKKNKQSVGKSIIKDRAKAGKSRHGIDGWRHTSELDDGSEWARLNLNSVTEQSTLDDFLATAQLAGTEFTAEKLNVTVVTPGQSGEGFLSREQVEAIKEAQDKNREFLRIPRRPAWDESTTAEQLDQLERDSFVEWRRQLAKLQDQDHILITPFERNLDFWRQLWRVIERSDVIVQIVDARNPLLFRCEDLEKYVKEVSSLKTNLLLMNKADFLTPKQRAIWARYFKSIGVTVAFWSALAENERLAAENHPEDTCNTEDQRVDKKEPEVEDTEEDQNKLSSRFAELSPTDEEERPCEDAGVSEDHGKQPRSVSDLTQSPEQVTEHQVNYLNCGDRELSKEEDSFCKPSELDKTPSDLVDATNSGVASTNLASHKVTFSDRDSLGVTKSENVAVEERTTTSEQRTRDLQQIAQDVEESILNSTAPKQDHPVQASGSETQQKNDLIGKDCLGQLLTSSDLLNLFRRLHLKKANDSGDSSGQDIHTTIGLVGYPNVGKSSTINAVLQDKKVPVSATPGRTKHFQTLNVSEELSLCDCPGLVYPSFVSTKAEMVINGILPIDQMCDHLPPVSLVSQRIPRATLEAVYGISIDLPREGENPDRSPHAAEVLNAYGYMRGYMTSHGLPDGPRSARYILKDYVQGKLLYCTPPPGVDSANFQDGRYSTGKFARTNLEGRHKSKKHASQLNDVDKDFFQQKHVQSFTKGVVVSDYWRTAPQTSVPEGVVPPDAGGLPSNVAGVYKPWKKHFNKNKREKLRRLVKN